MRLQVLAILLVCAYVSAQTPRQLGSIKVDWAAYTNLYENKNAKSALDRWTLLISAFNPIPFSTDYVYSVQSLGAAIKALSGVKPQVLTSKTTWPNEPEQVPMSVFGKEAVSIADGFLVPFKTKGALKIVDVSGATPLTVDITTQRTQPHEWFYHRVVWMDMNGDGRPDAVTARARKPLFGDAKTEFLWFEQPDSMPLTAGPWKPHLIDNGACTHLRHAKLRAGNKDMDVIVTAGYWTKKLQIYYTVDPNGLWTDNSMIKTVLVDGTPSKYFDLEVHDLNKDGRLDLLVTLNSEDNGSVIAYQLPDDFRSGTFKRHLLAGGFKARIGGLFAQGIGTPGSAETFYPTSDTSGKPYIKVAGDDDGRAHILVPKSGTANNWEYERQVLFDGGADMTIGKLTAGDVDGDGFTEIFAPAYQQGKVHVFTYAPEGKQGQLVGL